MKKSVLSLLIALMAIVVANAQQISVVSAGSTSLYRTFQEAIENAPEGSVIYLPGGGFPIADAVKITKKLTIVGIGNKIDTENPDGYTTVSGNLFFDQGSDFSALMGVYVSGNVYIGNDGNEVDDVLIRHCNINHLYVKKQQCKGITINQNYIRSGAEFAGSNVTFSNNITPWVLDLDDGFIMNNIITGIFYNYGYINPISSSDRTTITNNIILDNSRSPLSGDQCSARHNMCKGGWDMDEECIVIDGTVDWNNVFENYNGGAISPATDFHFKEKSEYIQYEGQVGIYSGDTPFEDNQLAPVPYIIFKDVPQKTNTEGQLRIRIRVKAGD